MYVPFNELSKESRVWVYTGNRPFTEEEEKEVSKALQDFCGQWNAHGDPLKSSFKIDHHQFIIMAVDEDFHNPSGCSIDSSVGVLRQIHNVVGVDFLDRSKVPFSLNNNVELIPLTALKAKFQEGTLTSESLVFNTMVTNKAEFESRWLITADKSWMTKYFPKSALIS